MDVAELERTQDALLAAIAEAKNVARRLGVGPQFREIVRHAREIHDSLLAALAAGGAHVTQRMRGVTAALGNAVDELEILDFLADWRSW